MSAHSGKIANPAVVGLAGFGLTTFLLQIHNLGFMEIGPVLWTGLLYGGLAQMIAGFQEQKTGNSFGYSAFVSYGAFWIALCLIFIGNHFGIYESSATDIGWFLLGWGLYTGLMVLSAIRIHMAMATTFISLFLGFVGLTIGHFGFPMMNTVAAIILLFCAANAWYMMAGAILKDVYGRDILPMGKPLVGGNHQMAAVDNGLKVEPAE